ncbi:MAG: ATP-dependent RNA helicase HrpA [Verrucomicrobiota bacterium]
MIRYPADLPISGQRDRILAALRGNQVVIVAGETGSGKTTQLPKMCLEAGMGERGRIGCTQPRRVAAMSISKRVAEEMNVPWGREVGCKMRFQDDTGPETVLKFMTDGILLAEIQSDPMLRSYSALIIDEAHERSLNVDFILGYLKGLLQRRRDLKLVITSATIDTAAFSEAFGGAPVIEVSGRTFPVEIRYWPMGNSAGDADGESEDGEESPGSGVAENLIESTVRAVEDVFLESNDGDVLVFLPTERDIREARDVLEGGMGSSVEVLSLYGRMAGDEQQRIFAPGRKRRLILATNIAETSLTIPRIRYVVDTGLARISRYAPRTRTKRLPVEPVSQSSANQRAGRAGRLSDGICVRLFSEEDFEKRPRFTQPEIQRANLAEVILRMKAFRLGEIETFPFLNPPLPASIRSGYLLLHELGALDDSHEMTPLGHELARLPLDPSLGRMLLQARHENVLPEILVIAAGLSIPDPRERPEEAREAAANAHKAFAHRTSDFLSLVKIWQAGTEAGVWKGSNAMRRFCKSNFLSFMRMREWRDIHGQLADTMGSRTGDAPLKTEDGPQADAVHRAILSALLGHVGRREERNLYKTAGNRQVQVFPGSHLHERRDRKLAKGAAPEKSRQPQWIVAAEIVETSQLFARTLAGIEPEWAASVGAHLCEFRYSEPLWDDKAGRVLALERVLLHGLELSRKRVDYGKIDPVSATEIFIRYALLEDSAAAIPHRFHAANRRLRDKLETVFARARSQRTFLVLEALFDFYKARISGVSSTHDLNRLVQSRIKDEPDFLMATEADLTGGREEVCDPHLFPDAVQLGNSVLPVSYAYRPGGEQDGVTVQVTSEMAKHLTSGQTQWLVPGLRTEIASVLLRALPKASRKRLMPFEHKIKEIATEFDPGPGDFLIALSRFISNRYDVPVLAADWPPDSLPPYLRPRVEVIDAGKRVLTVSRDLDTIRTEGKEQGDSAAWLAAAKKWSHPNVPGWTFGDLPDSVLVETVGGVEVRGFPGFECPLFPPVMQASSLHGHRASSPVSLPTQESRQNPPPPPGITAKPASGQTAEPPSHPVSVKLFHTQAEADAGAPAAVRVLAERVLAKDIAWLRRELRTLATTPAGKAPRSVGFQDALSQMQNQMKADDWQKSDIPALALEHLLQHALRLDPLRPLTEARFRALTETARRGLPAMAGKVREFASQISALIQQLRTTSRKYPGLEQDLARIAPPDYLGHTPHDRLPHLPRYLKAMLQRGERAHLQPAKDAERARQLAPFQNWKDRVAPENHETFRWMLEEFRVSLFAQELGTPHPISAKRLEALFQE